MNCLVPMIFAAGFGGWAVCTAAIFVSGRTYIIPWGAFAVVMLAAAWWPA